ncbi:MAG: cob(I)yrinic acid a,c-diamide adenosyltransferase [Ignisphaera sp.]
MGYRMKIVHRGDDGYTDIIGARIPKDSYIIEFIGSVDELVSFLGIIRSTIGENEALREIATKIKSIQLTLMKVAGIAAGDHRHSDLFNKYVEDLEKEIITFSKIVNVNHCFVVPGSSLESSLLHFARTLCRSVERRAVALLRNGLINKSVYVYLNRLSDLLYVYALYVDVIRGIEFECLD